MFDLIAETVRRRQPDYPPNQSMAGTNTYTHGCGIVGWTPGYCVCLHKIAAYERDQGLKSYPECEKAIRAKSCPALELRAQEHAAGKALFYVDRSLLKEEMDRHFAESIASYRPSKPNKTTSATTASVARTSDMSDAKPTPVKSTPVKRADILDPVEENGYAAAINEAIRQAASEPVAPVKPEPQPELRLDIKTEPKVERPSPSPVQGRSLLDIVRSQMGK